MNTENSNKSVEEAAEELFTAFTTADIPNHENKALPRIKLDNESVKFAAWICAEALRKESSRVNPERENFWISVQDYIKE